MKEASEIKADTATSLLNPSHRSSLKCLMCLPYMCAGRPLLSRPANTHTADCSFLLIPVISGATAVCPPSVSQLAT